ncbi:MAG: amidophosphoribosyltransferase, partial [Candidatus Saccharimonadales bacterium]
APRFLEEGRLTVEGEARMADQLGADSLRYLPVESIARAIGMGRDQICQACITGDYPTTSGQQLYQIALDNVRSEGLRRTYEQALT